MRGHLDPRVSNLGCRGAPSQFHVQDDVICCSKVLYLPHFSVCHFSKIHDVGYNSPKHALEATSWKMQYYSCLLSAPQAHPSHLPGIWHSTSWLKGEKNGHNLYLFPRATHSWPLLFDMECGLLFKHCVECKRTLLPWKLWILENSFLIVSIQKLFLRVLKVNFSWYKNRQHNPLKSAYPVLSIYVKS